MEKLEQFKGYLNKIENLRQATRLIHWDMSTSMPKNGAPANIAALTMLSTEAFKMQVADEMKEFVEVLSEPHYIENMDDISRKMVQEYKESYEENKNVPEELYSRYVSLTSESQHVWETAKHANDFETMKPYFEEMISLTKEVTKYTKPDKSTYDGLLDSYEKGLTEDNVDRLFKELKDGIVPLIAEISKRDMPDEALFSGRFSKTEQEQLGNYFLEVIRFNFDAGCMAESEHPFTLGSAPHDVRITTNYDLKDIRSSLFSVLHEGGHALYEQHIDPILVGTGLNEGTSMGIHESQSRFYENILGRNKAFWEKHYGKVQQIIPGYQDIPLEYFYRGINKVEPSLVRIEADELTYNLHIIIRFEIERALFNGTLEVADLPAVWHDKMKEYLGVVPDCHKNGILQDVHWPSGMFGYFPSYALGNIYSGQFLAQIEKEIGSIDQLLLEDRLSDITSWLGQKVHQYGRMKTPTEIIQGACNTGIDAKPIIEYYTRKYSKIYNL